MTRRPVLATVLIAAFCLAGSRMAFSNESTDLKVKLAALKDQIDMEKDKAKKEDLKKQERILKEQINAAHEKEELAAEAARKSKDGTKDKEGAGKAEAAKEKKPATGLNKFARFWTEEVGKPMRHFFHGD